MKRIHITQQTINILKLVKTIGYKDTAESMGISVPAVKSYIKKGRAPQTAEMAAGSIIDKQSLSLSNDSTVLIRASPEVVDIVRKVVENNNGTCSKISI